jgi:hypothetical protein
MGRRSYREIAAQIMAAAVVEKRLPTPDELAKVKAAQQRQADLEARAERKASREAKAKADQAKREAIAAASDKADAERKAKREAIAAASDKADAERKAKEARAVPAKVASPVKVAPIKKSFESVFIVRFLEELDKNPSCFPTKTAFEVICAAMGGKREEARTAIKEMQEHDLVVFHRKQGFQLTATGREYLKASKAGPIQLQEGVTNGRALSKQAVELLDLRQSQDLVKSLQAEKAEHSAEMFAAEQEKQALRAENRRLTEENTRLKACLKS